MTAVEDYKEGAVWGKPGNQVFMEDVAVDLSIFLEIRRTNCVEDSGGPVSRWITHLAAVSGIVEEVASTRLTNQPVNCGL